MKKIVLRERVHSCKWTNDFPDSRSHFFCLFSGEPCQFFYHLGKGVFQGNPYFRLLKMDFRANNSSHKQKKAVNEILFPIYRNFDSASRNEEFVKLTSSTFALNKKRLSRKTGSTRRNEALNKNSISTSWNNCFCC